MDTTRQPILKNQVEGRKVALMGDVYRFLAVGEETDGRYALMEAIVPPGAGPPPHIHSREEEGFYILEGTITFQIGDKRISASTGTFANIPVGTMHSFKNESNLPARMLVSMTPAGLEEMFLEVGKPIRPGERAPLAPTKEEIEKLLAAAPRYGIKIMLAESD